jgi:hypothetical protein
MSRYIAPLALGLALGAAAGWFAPRPSSSGLLAPGSSHLAPPSPITLPAWPWRVSNTPPALPANDASSAIAAWSSQRGAGGRAADFATRADSLHSLLVRLPPEAFPRLLATLSSDRSPAGLRLLDIGFDAWVDADPAAATRWSASAKPALDELADRGIRAWSSLDAEGAAAWACTLPASDLATRLAGRALAALAKKNPARALALANSRDDDFRAAVFSGIIGPLGEADPAAAVQAYGPLIWKNGDGFSTLREVLGAWAKRDPAAALAWLSAQPQDSSFMLSYRVAELARHAGNRAAIANAVATIPALPDRQEILVIILSDWKNENPAEALAWLQTLGDPDRSAQLLLAALNRSTPAKPELALALALGLPEGGIRTEKLGLTLAAWAKKDSSAALAWIRDHSEPGVAAATAEVHATLLATIARDEPATAVAEWQALADPKTRAAALFPIAQAWAASDPAAALDWYAAQKSAAGDSSPTGQDVYSLSKPIFAWAKKDPEAALRWAEKFSAAQTPGANTSSWARLAPFYALAGDYSHENAPRTPTADLYTKIQNPALRAEVLTAFVRNWINTDPASAQAWLAAHPALALKP